MHWVILVLTGIGCIVLLLFLWDFISFAALVFCAWRGFRRSFKILHVVENMPGVERVEVSARAILCIHLLPTACESEAKSIFQILQRSTFANQYRFIRN